MRGSPITYNAKDGNYWKDRVEAVNGQTHAVLGYRRGYQYWPLDGSAPQLLDEPGAPHPDRKTFGDQDEFEVARRPEWQERPLHRSLGAVLRQARHGLGIDVHHLDGRGLDRRREPGRRDQEKAPARA